MSTENWMGLKALDAEQCSTMTDVEAAAFLNTYTITELVECFISWRTIGSVLNSQEYAAFKAFCQSEAISGDVRNADMVSMLSIPGNRVGDNGGIDFGNADVRTLIDYFGANVEGMADAAAKLKEYGVQSVLAISKLGFTKVSPAHIRRIRSLS